MANPSLPFYLRWLAAQVTELTRVESCAADVRKVRQARFATAVRLLENVDAAGLRTILHYLPAWVKCACSLGPRLLCCAALWT